MNYKKQGLRDKATQPLFFVVQNNNQKWGAVWQGYVKPAYEVMMSYMYVCMYLCMYVFRHQKLSRVEIVKIICLIEVRAKVVAVQQPS